MNKIIRIKNDKKKLDTLIIELDGKFIKNLDDYYDIIQKKINGPYLIQKKYIIYHNEWIKDMDIIKKNVLIIIKNFLLFMNEDINNKKILMKSFEEDILPFWEEEVLHVVASGETREFNIILID